MNLDIVGTYGCGGLHLGRVRVDEQAGGDPGFFDGSQKRGEFCLAARAGEPAFGGELGALFGHQADEIGPDAQGQALHFGGGGHFKMKLGFDQLAQEGHVTVLNVSAVFPEVDDYGHGPGKLGQMGRRDRVGLLGEAGLAKRGHVVHVDGKNRHCDTLLIFRCKPTLYPERLRSSRGVDKGCPPSYRKLPFLRGHNTSEEMRGK